jgi:hypothetical protein
MEQNNFTPGFRTANNTFPTVLLYYDLCDCQPHRENPLYTMIDHSDDEDYMDNHDDDEVIEYQIPDRTAFYQLMDDILMAMHNEIQGYQDIQSSPGDDATNDILEAISLLNNMRTYDFI